MQLCRELEQGFATPIFHWAEGKPLEAVLAETEMAPGDFVRNCKQLLDLLRQVEEVAAARRRRAVRRGTRGGLPWRRRLHGRSSYDARRRDQSVRNPRRDRQPDRRRRAGRGRAARPGARARPTGTSTIGSRSRAGPRGETMHAPPHRRWTTACGSWWRSGRRHRPGRRERDVPRRAPDRERTGARGRGGEHRRTSWCGASACPRDTEGGVQRLAGRDHLPDGRHEDHLSPVGRREPSPATPRTWRMIGLGARGRHSTRAPAALAGRARSDVPAGFWAGTSRPPPARCRIAYDTKRGRARPSR